MLESQARLPYFNGDIAQVEKKLWESADQLRANSNLSAAEYSVPVLGLIFLRYADHKFAEAQKELADRASSRRRGVGKADYQARGVMYLPEEARFSNLLKLPKGANIGMAVNDAMRAIERENEELKDVLPKTYNRLDNATLVALLKNFSEIPVDLEGDVFGRIYEYFLGKFAMSEGQRGGEFFTPTSIVPREITDGEILDYLIWEGLSPTAAEDLTSAFRRIRLLASYYYNHSKWEDVREHETRTFLIIPLLLALGWSEQQLKIELGTRNRKKIDVACFSKAYHRNDDGEPNNEDCALIIESKGFNSGLYYADNQAMTYAKDFPSCEAVLVSNGYSYKAFERNSTGEFSQEPSAYLNLLKPRDRYPLDPDRVNGALGVLRLLLPQSWR